MCLGWAAQAPLPLCHNKKCNWSGRISQVNEMSLVLSPGAEEDEDSAVITTSRTLPKLPTTSDASRAETTTVKMQTKVPAQTKVRGWRATPFKMVPLYPTDSLMLTLFDLYGLKSPHKLYLMLLQPGKWIQNCLVSFLLGSLRRDIWISHERRERCKKEYLIIHKTVSHDTFECELYFFYISQRVTEKFYVKLPFLKENVAWLGCRLNTCQVPFSISVFLSTTIGNIVLSYPQRRSKYNIPDVLISELLFHSEAVILINTGNI